MIIAREGALTLAAIGGALSLILVLIGLIGGYSLILFKTGSMHPTIPAGSVALVKEIPAAQVREGDILTVDRAGALPVTHRVTAVNPGATPEMRTVTMQGDANSSEDPAPYHIETARITVGSLPHLAHVVHWFGQPVVMLSVSVATATLVTWAFWPRPQLQSPPATVSYTPRHLGSSKHGVGQYGAWVVAGMILCAPLGASTTTAQAAELVTLSSNLDPDMQYELTRTEPLFWDLHASASNAPEDGTLQLAVRGTNSDALTVFMDVQACSVPWSTTGCSGEVRALSSSDSFLITENWQKIADSPTPGELYIRLALTAELADRTQTSDTRVTVRATAFGEESEADLSGELHLADTGTVASPWLLLGAPIAILAGVLLATGARLVQQKKNNRA